MERQLLLPALLFSSIAFAQLAPNTPVPLFDHMREVNAEWRSYTGYLDATPRTFNSDTERIAQHLHLVREHLAQHTPEGLSAGQVHEELEDPKGYGVIEYAYYLMALDCGIDISECRLFKENGRSHFMTRRFDRLATGEKLHMQSLCALAHYDFNMAGAHSYEQALLVMRQLQLPMQAIEKLFRRMVFNIVARNQDDHVKNIAFLMNKAGEWSLSPAFDITYSFNPAGAWTASHQMTMNGKSDHFTLEDFNACARTASMKNYRKQLHDDCAQLIDDLQKNQYSRRRQ